MSIQTFTANTFLQKLTLMGKGRNVFLQTKGIKAITKNALCNISNKIGAAQAATNYLQ
jgi:hypothetical protein